MKKSINNRTILLTESDIDIANKNIHILSKETSVELLVNKTFNQNVVNILPFMPDKFADLIIIDPPYNIDKKFGDFKFSKLNNSEYKKWIESWFLDVVRCLSDVGTLYICGDWRSSGVLESVLQEHLIIRNRITFERDKGRGSKSNWKNCSEDIWFATKSDKYYFDSDSVKIKRKVNAPYKENGIPKDWTESENDKFRLTYPSNIWTDITIPFWSMRENTDHPTQKPEKLIAKLMLASSKENDIVLDLFSGSGTTQAVATKLNRRYVGVEFNKYYCQLAEHRVNLAKLNKSIQGYADNVFWERNLNNKLY